jgi:queuosine precursor transporter
MAQFKLRYTETLLNIHAGKVVIPHNEQPDLDQNKSSFNAFILPRSQQVFVYLTAIFVICLVIAELTGAMLFSFTMTLPLFLGGGKLPVLLSAGIIPFPVTFILTDLLNEFYGSKGARFVTWVGFSMCFLVFGLLWVAQHLPLDEKTLITKEAFDMIAVQYSGMFLASLTAYIIGQMLDIQVFHWLRAKTGHRFIGLRATGSTLISQLFDSFIVCFIAFSGQMSFADVVHVSWNNYLWKFIIAVLITPLLYLGHSFLTRLMPRQEERLVAAAYGVP